MSMLKNVKICGLSTPETVQAASACGAAYFGFVFVKKSPRYVTPEQAHSLAGLLDIGQASVALFANPTDEDLEKVMQHFSPDFIQLHGTESPTRVRAIKEKYIRPIIKAVGVSDPQDLKDAICYFEDADMMLYDAKPPKNAEITGGHGTPFDWSLLAPLKSYKKPYFVAGGITPENAAQALDISKADFIDLSSGVESAKGIKDIIKIKTLLEKL